MSLYLLFAFSLFTSAALLFWVQPLIAKMLLPFLGGAPAVWSTCMLFFQSMLLLGYLYVFATVRWFGFRLQVIIHFLLLAAAALFFPFAVSGDMIGFSPGQQSPVLWLLLSLLTVVGLPFFIVSTSSPLLQHWFSRLRHPAAGDPYFLFAASNLGSLTALLGFPLLLEPNITLVRQSLLWTLGYAGMAMLIVVCSLVSWRAQKSVEPDDWPQSSGNSISHNQRWMWVALAFVPSSLMLGVTQYISTDLAAVPLLWIVPLALYLLTFVLVFARRRWVSHRWIGRLLPGAALILTFVYLSGAREPGWFLIPLHLLFFFMAAMVCHGRLADDRPPANSLVEYYIWIAVGGMAGGIFNALLAPVLFNAILEYPLMIIAACLLLPSAVSARNRLERRLNLLLPAGICLLTIVLALTVHWFQIPAVEEMALVLGVPIFLAYLMRHRPVRLGLSVGAIMLGSLFYAGFQGPILHQDRNFFGVLRVAENRSGDLRLLYHGNTVHGKQFVDAGGECEPLAYYHRRGPLGGLFEAFNSHPASPRVAGIGLGVGAMVSYALPGQEWTFYEINPAVVEIARNDSYFSYLTSCAESPARILPGDARLSLREAPEAHYGLVVLDAFSSDAIPVHLITEEAIRLYLSKLAPGGMMAFHISNRSLDLRPVLAGAAEKLQLTGIFFDDKEQDGPAGKDPSLWAILARNRDDLGSLQNDTQWQSIGRETEPVFWTDDFSNILSVLKWLN